MIKSLDLTMMFYCTNRSDTRLQRDLDIMSGKKTEENRLILRNLVLKGNGRNKKY